MHKRKVKSVDTNADTDSGCDFPLVNIGRQIMCVIYEFIEYVFYKFKCILEIDRYSIH